MRSAALYAKNLEKYARDNPLAAYQLERVDDSQLQLCKTYEGEDNLVESTRFLYAQEGAAWEAQLWARNLPDDKFDVLFVFGLGLGYYYVPLKKWLEDPKHYLVFLEDDPRVVSHFLQTELASEILDHPQVIVKQISTVTPDVNGWMQLKEETKFFTSTFALLKIHVSALQSYFLHRFSYFREFDGQWRSYFSLSSRSLFDYRREPNPDFRNFYTNMPFIGEAILGYKLFGALQSTPVIICGAGPSIRHHLPLLRHLSDRALIVASGSAVNALTQGWILPHFGGAIDPTEAQASRQLTSYAYDLPAFYQSVFNDRAFAQWHGPLIYMTLKLRVNIFDWFDRALGIEDPEPVYSGVSTTNFLVETAGYLQCNPIAMTGIDLAYTQGNRYVAGVYTHPAEDREQDNAAIAKSEVVLAVPSSDGKEVYTTPHWFKEAVCMADFKVRHPQVAFVNATETGMQIPSVPDISLKKFVEEYLPDPWDMQGWFHGIVQNIAQEKIPVSKALKAMETWQESLFRCQALLEMLIQDLKANTRRLGQLCYGPYTGRASLWQVELQAESAYTNFLQILSEDYCTDHALQMRKWMGKSEYRRQREDLHFEIERCELLKRIVGYHIKGTQDGLHNYFKRDQALREKVNAAPRNSGTVPSKEVPSDLPSIPSGMYPKGGEQPVVEALIGNVRGQRHGQTLYFYPSAAVKVEAFYQNGQLYGPWSFYSEHGTLLYRSKYVDGKKQGLCHSFYSDGALYCVQGYRDGERDGEYFSYYPDGLLKTALSYKMGKLDGPVKLYYPNGRLKKEQHFIDGVLHGAERVWNVFGKLLLEAHYDHGISVGEPKQWPEE